MIEIKIVKREKKEKGEQASTSKRTVRFLVGTVLAFTLLVGSLFLSNYIWYNSGDTYGRTEGYIVEKNFNCTLVDNYITLDNGRKYEVFKADCNLASLGDKVVVQWNKAPWFEYQGFIVEWLY